ncbi:10448_t:CDS:1, partial [Cetraspora pellucida]
MEASIQDTTTIVSNLAIISTQNSITKDIIDHISSQQIEQNEFDLLFAQAIFYC